MGPKVLSFISGTRFGMLCVLEQIYNRGQRGSYFRCRCDCDVVIDVRGGNLNNGNTRSCGCLFKKTVTTHGASHTREYTIWRDIRARCRRRQNPRYSSYGGRGIKICDEWYNSFPAFLAYVGKSIGPQYSIDRIDNDGNYEPGNVRWATWRMQRLNSRKRSH